MRLYPLILLVASFPVLGLAQVTSNPEAPPPPDANTPLSAPDEEFPAASGQQPPRERMMPNAVEDPKAKPEDLGLQTPGTKTVIDTASGDSDD